MARKKKPTADPEPESLKTLVNVTLTDQDLLAKGHELAVRLRRIEALRKQKRDEAAATQALIDNELDMLAALSEQVLAGTEQRAQGSLKFGEGDAITDPLPTLTPEDADRIRSEKIAEGIVSAPLDVDLSAARAKNAESLAKIPKAPKAKRQAQPSSTEPVIVVSAPSSCPDCGSKVTMIDQAGVYGCADEHDLKCAWVAVVESPEVTQAIGAHA